MVTPWTIRQTAGATNSLLALLEAGGAAATALKRECRSVYRSVGFVHLPLFVDNIVVAALLNESLGVTDSFYSVDSHNPYLRDEDAALPATHPRNVQVASSKTIINCAQLGASSKLKALYESPELIDLVRSIVSPKSDLFRSQCPISSSYYNVFGPGDGLGWHFDNSDFGVNLVLQSASSGGDFEYHHNTRSAADPEAFHTVSKLLAGGCPSSAHGVSLAFDLAPGSLVVFSGHNSLHRVTPVLPQAPEPRVNVIFTFEAESGSMASDYVLRKFFGCTQEDQERSLRRTRRNNNARL